MGDMGDTFRAMNAASKDRRRNNREQSARLLAKHEIVFEEKNMGAHLVVEGRGGYIDFWPGTGRWILRYGNKHRGFGVKKLIQYIGLGDSYL